MARPSRRNRGLEVGVLLLLYEIWVQGYEFVPPVTLGTIVSQILIYLNVINVPWDQWEACISAEKVWKNGNLLPLFVSSFEHGDSMHLYYNMSSFLIKGRELELKYGSKNFAILLPILTALTTSMYVGLGLIGSELLDDPDILKSCAIGFSGVIFCLKFITTCEDLVGYSSIMGFVVPTRYTSWFELLVIHVLVPRSSFMGHLAGILVGCLYMKTWIGCLIDKFICAITGQVMLHSRDFGSARYSDYFGGSRRNNNSSYNYDNGSQSYGFRPEYGGGNFRRRNPFGSFGMGGFQQPFGGFGLGLGGFQQPFGSFGSPFQPRANPFFGDSTGGFYDYQDPYSRGYPTNWFS